LRGAFFNCGQNCVSAERFYVYDKIYDRFLEKVKAGVLSIQQGPGAPDMGAVNMPGQFAKYQDLINDAVSKGARILVGGKINTKFQGQFFEPTILVDVNHTMKVMQEETFGPVMAVMRVQSDDEAVKLANDSVYGLSCSIFSANYKRAHAIAQRIQAGGTVINDWGVTMMIGSLPFGGLKVSGFGKFNGPEGIRDFCFQKAFITDRFGVIVPPPKQLLCYPTQPGAYKLAVEFIKIIHVQGLLPKVNAVVSLTRKILFGFGK